MWKKWIWQGLFLGLIVFVVRYGIEMARMNDVDDAATINGGARTAFLEGAIEACLKNEDLKGQPTVAIQQYCTCYSNGMADRITNKQMKSWAHIDQSAIRASMEPVMEKAAQPCVVFFSNTSQK